MKKNIPPFKIGSWIKISYKNQICVGRTIEFDNKNMVRVINESGVLKLLDYNKLDHVVYFKFMTTDEFENYNSIKNAFANQQKDSNRLSSIIAKRQLANSMS